LIRDREYLVVLVVAAGATWLLTFVVRWLAHRLDMVVKPDERRVHEKDTATAGGIAMFGGMVAAMVVASQLGPFHQVFHGNSAPFGVIVAATVIFLIGLLDDLREMSAPAKLAGQVLAGTILYFFGVNMLYFHVPLAQTTLVLTPDLAALATVLWVAGMANSVNFIDGLDGLAAGIVAIGAAAFYFYSHQLVQVGNIHSDNPGPLIAVVAAGLCLGFLPHNFHPARIFMGDAGAMLLGLLMAASTLAVVGQNSYQFSGRTYFFFAPILIPFLVLGIPMLDTAFAILRRAGRRGNPAVADKNHLHHRLMRLGHGHRTAVLILWIWTALLSGVVLWPGLTDRYNEVPPIAAAALIVALYTLFWPRGRSAVARATRSAVPHRHAIGSHSHAGAAAVAVATGAGSDPARGDATRSDVARHDAPGASLTGATGLGAPAVDVRSLRSAAVSGDPRANGGSGPATNGSAGPGSNGSADLGGNGSAGPMTDDSQRLRATGGAQPLGVPPPPAGPTIRPATPWAIDGTLPAAGEPTSDR
jgi:UDP-GlcNAc:undecaprenyl-phosphate GlcNAc-1-phosphate transferase